MDLTNNIQANRKIVPKVYAYIIPDYPPNKGWVKIGDTTRDVETRIKEQTSTANVIAKRLWDQVARFNNENYFRDHDFHRYLVRHGIERNKEWFFFGEGAEMRSRDYFKDFTFEDLSEVKTSQESQDYVLREEQQEAVDMAYNFYIHNEDEDNSKFLWNAKPRFGKTLSAYALAKKMDAKNVLIVTNRPAIANSWLDDYEKFIADKTNYVFVSEASSLKGRAGVFTRNDFISHSSDNIEACQINFVGLQDLKGSRYHGGEYDKLKWVSQIDWDLVIIDEAHEAIDTIISDHAFGNIKSNFTLHLSGTPFKAISSGDFTDEQIYNWSYEDEQRAKQNWDDSSEINNPYEQLPKLNMYTYRMSNMIVDEIKEGAIINDENVEFAFDLNEFFSTNKSGNFVHHEDVEKWLETLTSNKKYPFSTPELRNELKHTLWMLERVDSAKALARLLRKHPVFENFDIVVAAGDGRVDDKEEAIDNSLDVVQKSIEENDKTITISVGQLTTGVTVPQWSAVLMLSNMKSAAQYMQTAFRSQNPNEWNEIIKGESVRLRKENAYVFDFAPERTLIIFEEFANNLSTNTSSGGGTSSKREENIKELLNFFPVIGEDENGEMIELDYRDVITIPKKIKASEVVKRGFMSNFLFANISGIFSAPQSVIDILDELEPEREGRIHPTKAKVKTDDVNVDEDGNVVIDDEKVEKETKDLFGGKIYGSGGAEVPKDIDSSKTKDIVSSIIDSVKKSKETKEHWNDVREKTGMTVGEIEKVKKENEKKNEDALWLTVTEIKEKKQELEDTFEDILIDASEEDREELSKELEDGLDAYDKELEERVKDVLEKNFVESTKEYFEEEEIKKETEKKNTVEDDVRSRLRGFARTIPSFIMAYGDSELTLQVFDSYVPEDVFKEVTGISIDQFQFLRDGGSYEEDGETKEFRGGLFDQVVFDESIKEFLNKRDELANYFEMYEEDIFDYIPPQETNQIYTPKRVVQMMVDALEEENPGIYNDSTKTFIDIYMKSGLYITEIVKRLYNSDVIKEELPNDEERIKHILENQVYGLAPSEIIYQISTNFIFANFDDEISRDNFKSVDVTPDVKEGKLQEKIDELFGEFESEAGKLRNSLGVRIV